MKIKGFTLIELLVVIAVIGILMGITITQIGGVRKRGYDAQIQAIVFDAMIAAEQYYIDNNSYPNQANLPGTYAIPACSTATGCSATSGTIVEGQTAIKPAVSRSSDGSRIAILLRLCGFSGCWCADSSGARRRVTGTVTTAGVCPSS
jgi:type IV pilus assembly protein PilE